MNEIVQDWNWTDARDFATKYGPIANPKAYSKFILVGSFFDSMGKLIEAGVTNAKLVPETLAVFAMSYFVYEKLKELGYRSPFKPEQSNP
jgi:hypothetical protein